MKKPARTWTMLIVLGLPLLVVGVAAMVISFATLIDVAKINGLPFPVMFPILVDVGMLQAMIVASQFKLRGIRGSWLAYLTFAVLSVVSIGANSTHALTTADMTVTSPLWAALVAATPPATLLATTHLVMMLIPDTKERQRLQSIREKQAATEVVPASQPTLSVESVLKAPAVTRSPSSLAVSDVDREKVQPALSLVPTPEIGVGLSDDEVVDLVQDFVAKHGARPTGKVVGDWLGKSAKTGQRFLQKMEQVGEFVKEDDRVGATV